VRKSRFNEEQIIAILKESEAGVEKGELCRRHGITRASFYRWKSKHGGMDVSEARRLKQLPEHDKATVTGKPGGCGCKTQMGVAVFVTQIAS
jgi:putative transposase